MEDKIHGGMSLHVWLKTEVMRLVGVLESRLVKAHDGLDCRVAMKVEPTG